MIFQEHSNSWMHPPRIARAYPKFKRCEPTAEVNIFVPVLLPWPSELLPEPQCESEIVAVLDAPIEMIAESKSKKGDDSDANID